MAEWAATFKVVFQEVETEFTTSFADDDAELKACFGEVIEVDHHFDPYEGAYIITPLAWQDQILATKDKTMTDDVTVLEVPYTEVSNIHGTTVAIATN